MSEQADGADRDENTKAIRIGLWKFGDECIVNSYAAPWGDDWNHYERALAPPLIEITVSAELNRHKANDLAELLCGRVNAALKSEGERVAREARDKERKAALIESLNTLPSESLSVVEAVIRQFAGPGSADLPF